MKPDPTKKPGPANDPLSEHWIDLRLIAGMRVVLGTSALLVVLIQPLTSFRWSKPTYITLVLYALYGLAIYHLSVRHKTIVAHRIIP